MERINHNQYMIYAPEDVEIKPHSGKYVRLGLTFDLSPNCLVLFQDIPEYVLRADVHVHSSTMFVAPTFEKEVYIIMNNDGDEASLIRKGNKLIRMLIIQSEIIDVEVK